MKKQLVLVHENQGFEWITEILGSSFLGNAAKLPLMTDLRSGYRPVKCVITDFMVTVTCMKITMDVDPCVAKILFCCPCNLER